MKISTATAAKMIPTLRQTLRVRTVPRAKDKPRKPAARIAKKLEIAKEFEAISDSTSTQFLYKVTLSDDR